MRVPDRVRQWRPDRLLVAAWLVAVLPVVVATARGIRRGWLPIGDNALVAIRAHDVFTAFHPWLGTWSSASRDAGIDLNHPGPLLFDSVALPVRLFGMHGGLAIGVMVVNVLAITTVAVFAHRCGGRAAALCALLATAFVAYTMGTELLFDPWNPHILILPCMALFVLAWGVALGDRWALPVYCAIGSYCVQTHLGYAYLVPGLLVLALALGWAVQRRQHARAWVVSGVVVLVLWSQPLLEQLFGEGEGNLSRILGARGTGGATIGAGLGVRLFSSVLAWAPWSARTGFIDAIPLTNYTPSGQLGPVDAMGGVGAVMVLLVVAALGITVAVAAWRQSDVVTVTLLGVAAAASAMALGSLVVMPIGPLGLTPHQMRWLWPLSAFIWMSLLLGALRLAPRTVPSARILRGVGVAAIAGVAVLSLPTYIQPAGPAARAYQIPSVAVLDAQLGPMEGIGTVYFDSSNTPLLDNFSVAILAELQRRGVPFTVSEPGLVRQFGNRRRGDSATADVRMKLLFGHQALVVPDGSERVALTTTLTDEEQVEFGELADRVAGSGEVLSGDESERYLELRVKADELSVAVVIDRPS
jgi:hypothetical protein